MAAALCLGAASLVRLLDEAGEIGGAHRQHHDHMVAEGQVGIKKVVIARDNAMLSNAKEASAQPVDSLRHTAVVPVPIQAWFRLDCYCTQCKLPKIILMGLFKLGRRVLHTLQS